MSLRFRLFLCVVPLLASHALAAEAQNASPNPLRAIAEDHLKAFVEAPLFDPARRLPPPAPVIVAPPPPPPVTAHDEPPPNLHLLGVIQGDDDIAIVRNGDNPKTTTVSSGDHIGSWTVTVLPTAGIRLSDGRKAFDYGLFSKPGDPVGPVAVPVDSAAPPKPAN